MNTGWFDHNHMNSVRILEGPKHNKRVHNPQTQTHMHVKRTYIFNNISTTEDSGFLAKNFNT